MPQELHVIRCYNCEAFQVHIVKKIPKWECKICGEKQSLKKVYGRGSGKDCRLLVQELNQKRLEASEAQSVNPYTEINLQDVQLPDDYVNNVENKVSGWTEFMPETALDNVNSGQESDGDSSKYTFERPIKRRKYSRRFNKCVKNNENINNIEIDDEADCNTSQLMGDTIHNVNRSQIEPVNCSVNEESKFKDEHYKHLSKVKKPDHNIISSRSEFVSTNNRDEDIENDNEDTHQLHTSELNSDGIKYENKWRTFQCNNDDKNNSKKSDHLKHSNFPERLGINENSNMNLESEKELKPTKWNVFMKSEDEDDNTILDLDDANTSSMKDAMFEKQPNASKWDSFLLKNEGSRNFALELEKNTGKSDSSENPKSCENDNMKSKNNNCFSFNTQDGDLDSIFIL